MIMIGLGYVGYGWSRVVHGNREALWSLLKLHSRKR